MVRRLGVVNGYGESAGAVPLAGDADERIISASCWGRLTVFRAPEVICSPREPPHTPIVKAQCKLIAEQLVQ
jgi:hypothetical protein